MSLYGTTNMGRMGVTAIIPTYNRAQYLGEAISSILAQTLPPAQVIVVDDGSTDNTLEITTAFGPRIEYLAKPNGGKSSALNVALPRATGEFIWIFDDDDIAEPDALEKLVHALHRDPECGFAYGDYDLFTTDEDGRRRCFSLSFPSVSPPKLYLALMERSFILQQGLLVRKPCYDGVGNFDESLIRSQDLEMMLRLARRYAGIKVEGIIFHQRQHAGLRGTKAALIKADQMIAGWVEYDRRIFDRIYATHALTDFLSNVPQGSELTHEQTITALIQRACIMARKGLWDYAARDLEKIGEIALRTNKTRLDNEQVNILRRVFDLFSYAPHSFAGAGEFRCALNQFKPTALQRQIRVALLWSLPFTIGAARLHGHKANFYRFLRIYFQLATPNALLRTLSDASFFLAGLDLVKNRRKQKIVFERP